MTEILAGIVMFTLVVLLLVVTLLVAKRKLVAQGDVTILINEDPAKALKVAGRQHAARLARRAAGSSSRRPAAARAPAASARSW